MHDEHLMLFKIILLLSAVTVGSKVNFRIIWPLFAPTNLD